MWVAPFGNPRMIGYLLLPVAYRSLSRPSSAPDAKAFPLRSFQLDLARRKVHFASLPPSAKAPLHSLAPPFQHKPASLGFALALRGTGNSDELLNEMSEKFWFS